MHLMPALIDLLVGFLVMAFIWTMINLFTVPEPFFKLVRAAFFVILFIWLISLVMAFLGHPMWAYL